MFIKFCEVSGIKLANLLSFIHGPENRIPVKSDDDKLTRERRRVVTCVGIQPQQYDVKTYQKLEETVYTVDLEISELDTLSGAKISAEDFMSLVYALIR